MDPETTFLQRVVEVLGLEPDMSPDDVLALIEEMSGIVSKISGAPVVDRRAVAQAAEVMLASDPAKFVPVETVQAMLTERNASIAAMSEDRIREKVEGAVHEGYLSPAMREWAFALCRSNEASFDAFLAKSLPAFAHLGRETHTRAVPTASIRFEASSPEAQAICAQLGIAPSALSD